MKQPNGKISILERGGLMIEALAMLGLIAVVTPTMYKKSAERTMEVDDINTSSTIRTVINAADSYVATNYSAMLGDMKDTGETVRSINVDELKNFLPYGFDLQKSLYNYNVPQLAVRRNGNSLTAFLLFPAKASKEDGLGQERTSRIASLIGANGGYVTDKDGDKSARGIGGIWKLDSSEFSTTFTGNPNTYSIVTASSEPINSASGGEIDNDKYLQRGKDDGDDTTWHNTMRTDLYMGNASDVDDDTIYRNSEYHNILGINQLIAGAKEIPAGHENDGLYIGNDLGLGKTNAFIQGSLTAANSYFNVDENRLSYGTPNEWGGHPFFVDKDAHAHMEKLTVETDVSLGYWGGETGWKNIGLGYALSETTGFGSEYVLNISQDYNRGIRNLDVMGDALRVEGNSYGLKEIDVLSLSPGSNGYEYGLSSISSLYYSVPSFPVRVHSNMSVDGALFAGRLDTEELRTTALKVGSEKVDDLYHWLDVDATGIKIMDPVANRNATMPVGTQATFNDNGIQLVSSNAQGSSKAVINLSDAKVKAEADTVYIANNNAGNREIPSNAITLRSRTMQTTLKDDVMTIGVAPYGRDTGGVPGRPDAMPQYEKNVIRTEFDGGNVELKGANLVVKKDGTNDKVLEVRGNRGDYAGNELKIKDTKYDASVYGNMAVFSSYSDSSLVVPAFDVVRSDAMDLNGGAVRILTPSEYVQVDGKDIYKNIMVVDQEYKDGNLYGESIYDASQPVSETRKYTAGIDDGTLYIRKGYMELTPDLHNGFSNVGAFGPGAFVASRMVANNKDDYGYSTYYVPELHNNNDNSYVRYDTYMVNPAYTSVMHDIKLTTRGGARLSDILPDFINKGIYVVNNSYKDNIKKMEFYFDGQVSVEKKDGRHGAPDTITSTSIDSAWASPYMGFIPSPKCPPGYSRVITLNPAGFRMGTVGNLTKASGTRKDNYYISNENNRGNLEKDEYGNIITPEFEKNSVVAASGARISGMMQTVNPPITGHTTLDVRDMSNIVVDRYTLTADSADSVKPIVFQQSDWLATRVVPLCLGTTSTIGGDECKTKDRYVSGWAAIMGFLYNSGEYSALFNAIGNNGGIENRTSSTVYWNVFPVQYLTMEAYGTVYCYFDRTNIHGKNNSNFSTYVDTYDSVRDIPMDESKERSGNEEYIKRLNDPTLKYNEVW